jgi:hypothetical protein
MTQKKVLDFINNNDIKEMPHDPTDLFHNKIKNAINKAEHILDGNKSNNLKVIKPKAPILRGLPKIHKDLTPIRPFFTSAPTYKIAKALDKLLRTHIKLHHNHSLKNSLELIDFANNIKIENRNWIIW